MTVFGILAGGGAVPVQVATAARAAGHGVFIVGLEGHSNAASLREFPHEIIRIGAVGRIREALRAHGCTKIVMVGQIRRPSLLHLRPDAEGARLLARLGRAAFAGDDGLLSALVRIMAEDGFHVVSVQQVLGGVLAREGVPTRVHPDTSALDDVARGRAVARALGGVDVGQGCVVQQGLVLAVEAIEGTDAMLARAGALRREGPGGVLVKSVKPGQDRRVDLPAVGTATVEAAAAAGLRGIAFEAGATLLIDHTAAIAAADAAGLFLLGYAPDDKEPS